MVILGKKHHTSSAMVGHIEFAKVQFFFKCVVVWFWRQINLSDVVCQDAV
jgi:hypothetical protein